jgi:YVTN family beta-propeller protein
MRSRAQLTLVVATLASTVVLAQAQYAKMTEIPVGGAGSFDYLAVDTAGQRLYVSHGTEVVVIDTATDKVVGRIADTPGVHGMAVVPKLNRIFTTNGRENKVSIVDARTLQTLSKVGTGANPDAITYDPTKQEIWAWNHTGKSATAIDAATGRVTATVPLAGVAESGGVDGDRVFVNIEDEDSIDVIDTHTRRVVAHWPVAPAERPTGMAVDAAAHRIFVGGGPEMVMMDSASGKVLAHVPICAGTDATAYDPSTKLVFLSCSEGKLTIVHVDGPDKLRVVQTLETSRGSRTTTVDPATHKIYLAGVSYAPPDPNAPPPPAGQRAPRPQAIPDSFRILVFGPR